MIEGNIDFEFPNKYNVIKFDDTPFYRQYFNQLPYAKGIDFLAMNSSEIIFLEVKDFRGREANTKWKVRLNKHKYGTNYERMDSLDIEIAEKVAMTLACLAGATTKRHLQNQLTAGQTILSMLMQNNLPSLRIILFLEGNFESHSKTQKMVMTAIKKSIQKKLAWLNCKVEVENLATQTGKYFSAEHIDRPMVVKQN